MISWTSQSATVELLLQNLLNASLRFCNSLLGVRDIVGAWKFSLMTDISPGKKNPKILGLWFDYFTKNIAWGIYHKLKYTTGIEKKLQTYQQYSSSNFLNQVTPDLILADACTSQVWNRRVKMALCDELLPATTTIKSRNDCTVQPVEHITVLMRLEHVFRLKLWSIGSGSAKIREKWEFQRNQDTKF